jgi:hypothetical protein
VTRISKIEKTSAVTSNIQFFSQRTSVATY